MRLNLGIGILMMMTTLLEAAKVAVPHNVILFFERAPAGCTNVFAHSEKMVKKMGDPCKLNHLIIKGHIKRASVEGICVFYSGSWTYSDNNGEVLFPLKHEGNSLMVIITQRIQPVIGAQGIVQNFFIPHDEPYAAYLFTRTNDKQREWVITQKNIPANSPLPYETFIIIAKPQDIIIPKEHMHSLSGPHMILPTIFVAENARISLDALHALGFNRYFSPVARIFVRSHTHDATIPIS